MASVTKFYPCANAAPYTPTTYRGGWDINPNETRTLANDKTGVEVAAHARQSNFLTNPKAGVSRLVSNPLAAQTITGTLNMAMNVVESVADVNAKTKIFVYVTQGDTDTPRGTLLEFEDTGGTEWPVDPTEAVRAFSTAQALSSLGITAGDRLVIEFGIICSGAANATRTVNVYRGSTSRNDDGTLLADAVVGATGTGVTRAGYFEFSQAIDILTPAVTSGDLLVGNQSMYLYNGTTGALKQRVLPIGSEDPAGAAQAGTTLFVSYESLNVSDDPQNGQIALYNPSTLVYDTLFQTAPGVGPHSISPNSAGQLYVGFTGENLDEDLGGFSCGEDASTAETTLTRTASGVTTLATASVDLSCLISVEVMQDFLNGDGTQPTFKIGTNTDDDFFCPTSTFTNAQLGDTFSFSGNVLNGLGIRVTAVAATGATSTGSIFVRLYSLAQMSAATYAVKKYSQAGVLLASYSVDAEIGGSNAIDLAADQKTLYYTSLGRLIKRYDVSADGQLSDFYELPPAVDGQIARGLRILSDGSVLVVDTLDIKRINAAGTEILQTYELAGQDDWGTISLTPSGTEFWVANRADGAVSAPCIAKFNVSSGALVLRIDEDDVSLPDTGGGMCSGGITCIDGYRAAVPPVPPDDDFNGPGGIDVLEGLGLIRHVDIRWLRRAPVLANENKRVFYNRFELDMQVGSTAKLSGHGYQPVVLLHWSNDGGFTWFGPRQMNLGEQGDYGARLYLHQLGMARKRVFQASGSDPVQPVLIAAFLDPDEGLN